MIRLVILSMCDDIWPVGDEFASGRFWVFLRSVWAQCGDESGSVRDSICGRFGLSAGSDWDQFRASLLSGNSEIIGKIQDIYGFPQFFGHLLVNY